MRATVESLPKAISILWYQVYAAIYRRRARASCRGSPTGGKSVVDRAVDKHLPLHNTTTNHHRAEKYSGFSAKFCLRSSRLTPIVACILAATQERKSRKGWHIYRSPKSHMVDFCRILKLCLLCGLLISRRCGSLLQTRPHRPMTMSSETIRTL